MISWPIRLWRTRLSLILVGIMVLAGCSKDRGPETTTTLSASPNPVPSGQNGKGSTVISWSLSGGEEGAVYVSINGEEEILFSGLSRSGKQKADWIHAGSTYEFRLYHRDKLTKTLTVTQSLE